MTSASMLGLGVCLLAAMSPTGSVPGASAVTGDTIVAGIRSGDGGTFTTPPPIQPTGTLAGTVGIAIDFDDVSAPCAFSETQALRGEYAAQGLIFWGQGPFDGGAVLDECSNFSVTGYSAPNFLAFNEGAFYANGGVAKPPAYIRVVLPGPVQHFELRAGTGLGSGTLTLTGVRADATTVASNAIVLGSALQTVAVDGQGIVGVIITSTVGIFVIDDLAAN